MFLYPIYTTPFRQWIPTAKRVFRITVSEWNTIVLPRMYSQRIINYHRVPSYHRVYSYHEVTKYHEVSLPRGIQLPQSIVTMEFSTSHRCQLPTLKESLLKGWSRRSGRAALYLRARPLSSSPPSEASKEDQVRLRPPRDQSSSSRRSLSHSSPGNKNLHLRFYKNLWLSWRVLDFRLKEIAIIRNV